MSYQTTAKTVPINSFSTMKELGIFPSRGGFVVLDQDFTQQGETLPELCKFISVGSTGDVVLEYMDGKPGFAPNLPAGYLIVGVYKRVLSSYDFGGSIGVKTTTATELHWHGGQ